MTDCRFGARMTDMDTDMVTGTDTDTVTGTDTDDRNRFRIR